MSVGMLCESPAFLILLLPERFPSAQTPGLCRITPSLVLQGDDKCSNSHNDNSSINTPAQICSSLLAKRESPLQTPKPTQIAAQPPSCTVCCPCLSPADHMDTHCSQTAPAVPALHPWKPGREKQDPRRRWEQSLPDSPWVSP